MSRGQDVRIRTAEPADAEDLAEVHVRSWQKAYRGIIPDDFLDHMNLPARATAWRERLANPDLRAGTFVGEIVARPAGVARIAGFGSGGPERDGLIAEGVAYDGELYAIYLLPEYWRMGLGRQLTAAVVRFLLGRGCKNMLVWVLAANPARGFYEALGGRQVAEKIAKMSAGEYPEVAYAWRGLAALMQRLEDTIAADSL